MKNKRILLLLSMITIIITSCATVTVKEKKMEEGFFQEKYGKILYNAGKYNSNGLEFHKTLMRRFVLESTQIPEEEKKSRIKEIEKYEYEEGKFFYFVLIGYEPIWDSKLPKNISLHNSRGGEVKIMTHRTDSKETTLTNGGSYVTYRYSYLLELPEPYTSDNENMPAPLSLVVDFDNDNYVKYEIK